MKRVALVAVVTLGLTLAGTASARPDAAAIAKAENFFDAGAQAFETGEYVAAAESFMKAHALVNSPALIFSAAQAYRRDFLTNATEVSLHEAVRLYRQYVKAGAEAKRREDAMLALEALAPVAAKLVAAAGTDPSPTAPVAPPNTRLLLAAGGPGGPAAGAQVSVDGQPYRATPLLLPVSPGPHRVRVNAPGYHDGEITVLAIAGELVPHHVQLEPVPAHVVVTGTAGAVFSVDGRARATVATPPIAVDAGARFVSVTRSGHVPYAQVLDLERGSRVYLDVELMPTRQRVGSWVTLGVGAASLVACGVLAGFVVDRDLSAATLRDKLNSEVGLLPTERDVYNATVAARDDFVLAAAVTGGAGLLTLVSGVALYAFDNPDVVVPRNEPAPSTPKSQFTIGFATVGVSGSF